MSDNINKNHSYNKQYSTTADESEYSEFMKNMGFDPPRQENKEVSKHVIPRHILILCLFLCMILVSALSVFITSEIYEYNICKQNAITMQVTVSKKLIKNSHVGDLWEGAFKVNGISLGTDNSTKLTVWQKKTITVESIIQEIDEITDKGTKKSKHKITENDLRNGFKTEHTVRVTENRGTYAGNSAEWLVTYTFKPIS